jgi:hypothetical protein
VVSVGAGAGAGVVWGVVGVAGTRASTPADVADPKPPAFLAWTVQLMILPTSWAVTA